MRSMLPVVAAAAIAVSAVAGSVDVVSSSRSVVVETSATSWDNLFVENNDAQNMVELGPWMEDAHAAVADTDGEAHQNTVVTEGGVVKITGTGLVDCLDFGDFEFPYADALAESRILVQVRVRGGPAVCVIGGKLGVDTDCCASAKALVRVTANDVPLVDETIVSFGDTAVCGGPLVLAPVNVRTVLEPGKYLVEVRATAKTYTQPSCVFGLAAAAFDVDISVAPIGGAPGE